MTLGPQPVCRAGGDSLPFSAGAVLIGERLNHYEILRKLGSGGELPESGPNAALRLTKDDRWVYFRRFQAASDIWLATLE